MCGVNSTFGAGVGLGLFLLGVEYALLFGILAANARPTAATACGVLGLLAMWWCRQDRFTGRPFRAALGLSLLPGLTAAAVFWLKLGTPVPSVLMNRHVQEAPHWKAILEQNGRRTGGAMFAPTALALYFRPDTVVSRSAWPIADFRFPHEPILWIPPLPVGGAYVERTASVTATMPLPWLLTVVMAIGAGTSWARERRSPHPSPERREEWTVAAGLFASALAMTALTVTTVGMTNRYLPDFYAISAVGVVFAHRRLLPWLHRHRALGALAGLVAVTPAAGFAGPVGAIGLGFVAGATCLWFSTSFKNRFQYDDSLDVFGVHCVAGILGTLAVAVLASPKLGGTGIADYVTKPGQAVLAPYDIGTQLWAQLKAVLVTLAWSGFVTAQLFKLVDFAIGLRLDAVEENVGLDISDHGERSYN